MILHQHFKDLKYLCEMSGRSSHTDTLGSYEDALKAALAEFEKTGSTVRPMGEKVQEIEKKLLKLIQQTHLHPELGYIIERHLDEIHVIMEPTYFFSEEPTTPLTDEEKAQVK